jgi:hypothetical protein
LYDDCSDYDVAETHSRSHRNISERETGEPFLWLRHPDYVATPQTPPDVEFQPVHAAPVGIGDHGAYVNADLDVVRGGAIVYNSDIGVDDIDDADDRSIDSSDHPY